MSQISIGNHVGRRPSAPRSRQPPAGTRMKWKSPRAYRAGAHARFSSRNMTEWARSSSRKRRSDPTRPDGPELAPGGGEHRPVVQGRLDARGHDLAVEPRQEAPV